MEKAVNKIYRSSITKKDNYFEDARKARLNEFRELIENSKKYWYAIDIL